MVGIRDLCSVWAHSAAFRFSVRSKLTTYLVKASFHTRREPRCFRRDRLILTPKSGLVVGIRTCARFGPIRQRSASAISQRWALCGIFSFVISYLVSSSSYGGRPLGSERPRRPAPAVSLILEPSRVAQAAHNDGDDRRERCACHKRARTFSHLTITVLLLLRARHVHVRRHSMHIFA